METFRNWLFNCFFPKTKNRLRELGQEKKEILYLGDCSAHPSEEELISADGKTIAMFLPPNLTAILQPIDQGVLEPIKSV